jgi:hypothetical protein
LTHFPKTIIYLPVEALSALGRVEGETEVPETKARKPSRSARDRDFENLLRAASRRLNLHPLKPIKHGRQEVKTLVFTD